MQLIRYDAACRALAEAKAIDEVKDLRDKAAALKAYAKQAGNKQLEVDAAEIRIRAERRVGQLMDEQRATVGLAKGRIRRGSELDPRDETAITLEDMGIDKHLADRSRKLAKLPDERFEEIMAEHREQQATVTDSTFAKLTKGVHVGQASGNDEWYTPPPFIESARKVMGSIDTDPCSNAVAQAWIKARRFFTAETDGLKQKWQGNVWMNPPYSDPLVGEFTKRFVEQREAMKAGITLTNNATETEWCQRLQDACDGICLPSSRIRFYDHTGQPRQTPLQGQIIMYFGPDLGKFLKEFRQYGQVYRHA